ncbi:response regulator transcription factor [Gaetbulibacter aestuarii]|uniref:Response regulator transcription factor n=1 Tax=Gaetbulibacter aestuarii TaxID=1502358 RepID=A0ABW7MWV7_9FLAO
MRILIVEDEPGISNFLKQGLEEESYVVDVHEDGNAGLKSALTGTYDLLLLDWMLPGLSGIEICQAFREKHTETPIIFLTAKDTVDETILGLKSGANDYIKKPFHFEELLQRIKVQFRNTARDEKEFKIGDITLNTGNHKVFKGSEEISLTQKEFALLEYLMRHKGHVCERTQIIKDVWDIHFEYNTGVIDVYINAIRKKLQLNETNYIETIRGIGYILNETQEKIK